MSSQNPLTQLRLLDTTSPTFYDQVSNILCGKEYIQWMSDLQGEDLVELVDYLDNVCRRVSLCRSNSTHSRLSILSKLTVPLSGSVCANSEIYVAQK